MQEKILEFLKKKHGYVSGEQLSEHLKISRQGLWKHIQELKDLGYEIEAVPHLGYKLSTLPDRLYDFEVLHNLGTKILGKRILYFDSLNSTMDMANQLGLKGLPEGTIIIAETQNKGRGRLGRSWSSPKHKGLYFSLILRPDILPQQVSVITLLVAVSICEAIKTLIGQDLQIKWPNDIILHNKKLGGILTELSAETDKINFVNIGIGLNINNDKKSLISGAVSLKEITRHEVSRVKLLQEILRRLESNYLVFIKKGSSVIIEKWRHHSLTLGRRVKVYSHKAHIEGQAVNIDSDGSLLIRKDSGVTLKVTAGEVVHCK